LKTPIYQSGDEEGQLLSHVPENKPIQNIGGREMYLCRDSGRNSSYF
jgi:hypothetical protein